MKARQKKVWVMCHDCGIVQDAHFEVWCCDKNPKGLSNLEVNHGNDIDGVITCDDDYCKPQQYYATLPSSQKKSEEYMATHEGLLRCCECDSMCDDTPIWKIFPNKSDYQEKVPRV